MKKILFSACVLLSCSSCTENLSTLEVIAMMSQSWTRSNEEGEGIYRPSESKPFQMLRYREVVRFSKDGTCEYLVLHPADAHFFEQGTWSIASGKLLEIKRPNGSLYKRLEILDIQPDLLRVNTLYSAPVEL